MAVVPIQILLKRFQTTDEPSKRDYTDLIETLAAGVFGAPPSGAAGGALDGEYPDPTLHADSNDVNDTDRPVTGDSVRNHTLLLKKISTSGATEGSRVAFVGSAVVWQAASEDAVGATLPVSGAVNIYTSDLIALPASSGHTGFPLVLPDSFVNIPDNVRWVAVCQAAFAGYEVGDEVPIDNFRIKNDDAKPCFTPAVTVDDSGPRVIKLQMRVEYGTPPNGFSVQERDSTGGVLHPHTSIGSAQTTWLLKAYATYLVPGTGFGSLSGYASEARTFLADAATETFTHGLNQLPPIYRAVLVCQTAVNGFAIGDEISTVDVFDALTFVQALVVDVSATSIKLRRASLDANISYVAKDTGSVTVLDTTKWKTKVYAYVPVNVPTFAFPALSYSISNPVGAAGYGALLLYFQIGPASSPALTFLNKIMLSGNTIGAITSYTAPYYFAHNLTYFRFPLAGVDRLVWAARNTSTANVSYLNLDDLTTHSTFFPADVSSDLQTMKPVWFAETPGSGTPVGSVNASVTHPDIYLISSASNWLLNAVTLRKCLWNGSAYTITQTALDFRTNVPGLSAYVPANSNILLLQYNPIKNRLYLIENYTGLLTVLKLEDGINLAAWWVSPDWSKWSVEKRLVLAGMPVFNAGLEDHYTVEFDLNTGQENSITMVGRGLSTFTGAITRIPWRE